MDIPGKLSSPRDRYENDPAFNKLINMMEAVIHSGDFTPSEIRQAAVYASIKYEMMHIRARVIPGHLVESMRILEEWVDEEKEAKRRE